MRYRRRGRKSYSRGRRRRSYGKKRTRPIRVGYRF